jgi:hypothetical protein
MSTPSLVTQYENFRSSMVAAINALEIDENQKQVFMISLQSFYLQMLLRSSASSPVINGELIQPEIVN